MAILGLILLVALLIPITGLIVDSNIGRAIARRLEGGEPVPAALSDLAKKVEVLEGEVEDLQRTVTNLQEENQFLQRLLEDHPGRSSLPPPKTP